MGAEVRRVPYCVDMTDSADVRSGPRQPQPARAVRAARATWDLPVAIIGLVVLAAVTALAATFGTFIGWAGAGCGVQTGCNSGLSVSGLFLGTFGVIIVAIVFLVITIARLAVRRIAWWPPVVGSGAVSLVFVLGTVLASIGAGAGGATLGAALELGAGHWGARGPG